MDGKLGTYKGYDVYYLDLKEYFKDPKKYNDQDVFWALTDGNNALMHRGKVFARLGPGNSVTHLKTPVTMEEEFPAAAAVVARKKTSLERGNITAGVAHKVTERKSVDWYMEHSLKVLEDGVKYGERRLAELTSVRSSVGGSK